MSTESILSVRFQLLSALRYVGMPLSAESPAPERITMRGRSPLIFIDLMRRSEKEKADMLVAHLSCTNLL